jgi:hypothetical protein
VLLSNNDILRLVENRIIARPTNLLGDLGPKSTSEGSEPGVFVPTAYSATVLQACCCTIPEMARGQGRTFLAKRRMVLAQYRAHHGIGPEKSMNQICKGCTPPNSQQN